MKPPKSTGGQIDARRISLRLVLSLLGLAIVVILLGIFSNRTPEKSTETAEAGITNPTAPAAAATRSSSRARESALRSRGGEDTGQTAQEIVAGKVIQFAKHRRELLDAMAKHLNVQV